MKQMMGLMLAASIMVTADASAQTAYPEKTIRIVVGFPPGGPSDIVARVLGQKLESLGKAVVVENIPGAAGNIGAERVAKAAPDGYTLALANQAAIVVNPALYKLSYDPVKDFAPISQVVVSALVVVVHPS